jgi:hypothetical protein
MRAALVMLVLALATTARAELIDRIMAVVGGQPITLSDVSATLQFRLVQPPAGTRDPLMFALDRAIERSLMLVEVDRFQPPEPDPVMMTIRIDEFEGDGRDRDDARAAATLHPRRSADHDVSEPALRRQHAAPGTHRRDCLLAGGAAPPRRDHRAVPAFGALADRDADPVDRRREGTAVAADADVNRTA